MTPWVSFDEVKARVSIEDVLRRYSWFDALQQKGKQLVGLCPFHKESKASFKVTPERNLWHCFGTCQRGGDVIDLVVAAEGIATGHRTQNRRQAALFLAEWYVIVSERPTMHELGRTPAEGLSVAQEEPAEPPPEAGAVVNPPLPFALKRLDHEAAYAYAEQRGIGRSMAEHFGLAVALFGGYKGRLVIPLLNAEGTLVGYAARALDDSEPKYLFPSREKGFYKSHLVFNAFHVIAQQAKTVVITEGFFDTLKVTQAGFPCVALMGCEISAQQAELLCTTCQHLVLMLDGDPAGRAGTERALVEIGRRGRYVRAVCLPDSIQPDTLSEDELRSLLKR